MTYGFDTDEQERVGELLGVGSMDEMNQWLGDKNEKEILAELNKCWPQDDNADLASRVYNLTS